MPVLRRRMTLAAVAAPGARSLGPPARPATEIFMDLSAAGLLDDVLDAEHPDTLACASERNTACLVRLEIGLSEVRPGLVALAR